MENLILIFSVLWLFGAGFFVMRVLCPDSRKKRTHKEKMTSSQKR